MAKISKIGGQAVLEGVMMRSPERLAIAVRNASGIVVRTRELRKGPRPWYRRTPLVRGVCSFVDMLVDGMSCLNTSAEMMGIEEEPGKFEKWLSKKTGKSAMDIATGVAMVLGVALAVGLFILLPQWLTNLLGHNTDNSFAKNLIDGALRMALFIGYLSVVSLMPDIKRFFAYHGSEHKVVNCYEHGLLLTVENAQRQTTRHPRCGTSFLLIVMVISVLVFSLTGWHGPTALRMLVRIALLPVVAAVSFEALMLLAKWNNWFVRALRAPGMWLQALTTREPDDGMVEVAIAAFAACLDEEERASVMPPAAQVEEAAPIDIGEPPQDVIPCPADLPEDDEASDATVDDSAGGATADSAGDDDAAAGL